MWRLPIIRTGTKRYFHVSESIKVKNLFLPYSLKHDTFNIRTAIEAHFLFMQENICFFLCQYNGIWIFPFSSLFKIFILTFFLPFWKPLFKYFQYNILHTGITFVSFSIVVLYQIHRYNDSRIHMIFRKGESWQKEKRRSLCSIFNGKSRIKSPRQRIWPLTTWNAFGSMRRPSAYL